MMDCEAQNLPTPTAVVPHVPTMQAKQQKDPKKQVAGRKSAESRRKKMEALNAELIAAKETDFYKKNNKEVPETVAEEHVDAPKLQVAEQRVSEHSERTPGWIMGISLAVLIGAVL